ncbi:slr2127 [Synechocystis sp. PCC 6803]|uniref:Slr2127 protein n=1 Tax=Synechocystis sp. (strain ATCC 27184 / PCC 6803 / Kazusa) TaxID=1111708 RepID=P73994_SYNY3|nr:MULTISPECIES: hypothetical protein [unclassified Synechocystis]BAM51812.1 hypothetical protein BEST7613_2881 [Synechocystis sp. PCC 6803] [Bacillus subtilis BEST7613]AGF51752.1 hypothetical protein MYO_115020 [Synechocystis sp. PCC 6803]ALJ67742.1 hypothetical protein AOY38_07710 [Synechocystis sp. PCC 6803]AVP89573.1 hypothetical protein C7I86_07715 [Synechocystis sp. IPPAS B-1465]MBD2618699.1 hypothetical protein [Synechocystis sp. FACHB-898]
MATTPQEVWQLLGELAQAQKETERLLKEQSQEADRRFQETERLLKEQSQRLLGQLGNRLGEFVEYQVRPAAVRLFRERGIDVHEISTDLSVQKNGQGLEIDLLVVNGNEAIAIEVKSKLDKEDVDEHLERMSKFKRLLPRYQPLKILGAVAAMVVPNQIASYAYRKGLFVIAQSGDDLMILNDAKFRPKAW